MMQEDGPVMTFGLWLRRWRQAMDLSRPELAEQVGCSRPMIRQIEADINRPSARLAARLAAAIGVPLKAQDLVVACARGQRSAAILPLPSLAVAMAAPLRSPGHVPHPTTPLVGRDRELAALINQLTRPATRLITLTGLMGVGKTHLARTAAVTVQSGFEHGAWFVELPAAADPTMVARAMAHALGVADPGTRPIEAQVAIALAKHTMLLVLDGLEPAPPVTALVKGLLGAARLTVLTTSSRPLGLPGEAVVPISPLATPQDDPPLPLDELATVPAVALFVERARAVAPGFALTEATAPAITGISRRLGGLPLAIELAAARLQVLSPDELAATMERDVDAVLTLTTSPSAGHRSLLAALEGARASLPDRQRRTLDRLAIFPAGFGRPAAQAVAAATMDDLTSLITAGLVRYEAGDRFVLHDLVRRVAARRLAQAGENLTVARSHAEHYLQLAEEAVPALPSIARDQWLAQLAAEEAHLQAALSWAIDHEPPLALRMAAALPWYWYFRGAFGQGRSWLERALTAAPANDDTPVRAHAQAGAGALAWAQGDHAAARAWLESGIGELRLQLEHPALVHALAILTLTAHDQGDHRAALSWAREGTAAARAQPDPWSLALALTAEGAAQLGAGDLQGADKALAESLEIWARLRDSWGLAMALLNQGRVAFAKDEYAAAATYLEDGLDRLQHAHDRRFSAAALLLLGEIARRQGDLPLAQARFAASLIAYQETGTEWGICLCLEGLAATVAAAGQAGQAARLLGAAAAVPTPGAASRPPDQAATVEHLVAGLQSALGEENFRAHWTAGHILTAEQAVAKLAGLPAATASKRQTPH